MASPQQPQPDQAAAALAEMPDRTCTWCKVPMVKRLVGRGQFIHYTCPKCIFQHTSKREKK
jgi:ssDNA-binding Zn-finger/Zn-ribbon topoisomerase 1